MKIGERIKKVRKDNHLTQQDFAAKIGVTQNTIARYEMNKIVPSNAALTLICQSFNVHEEWLRTGEGEMFNERATIPLNDPTLDELDKAILQSYIKMPPARRAFFKAWVREMLALFSEHQKTATEAESEHIREVVDALSIPREEVIRLINDAYDKKEKKDAG